MDKVRYKVREVLDKNKIDAFLQQARIGHLVMVDGHLPYVVLLILCGQMECFISMELLAGDEIK
jgi:nitroimidazol reductase NimA-like FMN-containing flavoprotein (pyridoxamine 5'-phosphate oxidase superfamily)